jgi:nucleotide-binding universal stress UspA family protein
MFKKILVCSDGSEHALQAAAIAAQIAARFDSRVLIINVISQQMEPVLLAIGAGPVSWDTADNAFVHAQEDIEGRTGVVFRKGRHSIWLHPGARTCGG